MRALLILLAVMMAGSAAADDFWYTTLAASEAATSDRSLRRSVIRAGQTLYFSETGAASDDSKVLDTTNCVSFTALFISPDSSAGTAHLMDNISPSSNGEQDTTRSVKILNGSGDLDLTGDPATGLAYIYNIVGVNWIWVDVTTNPGSTKESNMRITCHAPQS